MPETSIQRLLLILDGSGPSETATDYALNLAGQLSCGLITAFVIDSEMLQQLYDLHVLLQEERDELVFDLELQGKAALKDIRQRCQARQIAVIDMLQCQGSFHKAVLQVAKQFQADAIVLGGWSSSESSQHRDVESVQRRLILDQATCPVFIVKD